MMEELIEELEFGADAHCIWNIFSKYHLNDALFHMNEKYLSTIIGRMVYDYRVMDSQSLVNSRWDRLPFFLLKIVVIHGGALLSIYRSKKVIEKIKYPRTAIKETVIALPFADHIVRFKRLREMVKQDVYMFYHPLFHFNHIQNHVETYNILGQQVDLGVFSFKDIMLSFRVCLRYYFTLKRCSREIDSYFKSASCKLPGVVIFFLLYRHSLDRVFGRLSDNDRKRIWLLDYDFDYKYAIFNDVIHSQRPNDITIHLQHGSFTKYSDVYCNPSSDISCCCSPREKVLIQKHNKHQATIFSLGAPLQTFIDKDTELQKEVYDVLFLLTTTYEERAFNMQRIFLSSFDFDKYNVLVRYRPASRTHDEEMLREYTKNADISSTTTLNEDVLSSKVIVSFSIDALFTCLRNNKRVIVIGDTNFSDAFDYSYPSNNILITEDPLFGVNYDWASFIKESHLCDYAKDQFAMGNFGINSFDELSVRFNQILKEI